MTEMIREAASPPAALSNRRRVMVVEISWRTIFRVLAGCAIVWCWLQLTWLFLLVLVAILLAVTLDPVVRRLEGSGLPRWGASTIVVFVLVGIILGFAAVASSQLSTQGQIVGERMVNAEQALLKRFPWPLTDILGKSPESSVGSYLGPLGLRLAQALANALLIFVLAVILTLYLLIEGRTTYAWLLAFVPLRNRQKVALTMAECQTVIFGYVSGNVATSVFAAVFVFISLRALGIPAALLLAILAGVCDFVPVVGFAVSAFPAIVLGLTKSPTTGVVVVGLYAFYHTAENYFIAPYVYGDKLRLSNIAIVLAFAVGAELAGVVGALIALPIAAAYPAIERIWLKSQLGDEVVKEHAVIEHQGDA